MRPLICCPSGKVGYSNEDGAEMVLEHLRRKGREERRVYECPRCGNWHLTRMPLSRIPAEPASTYPLSFWQRLRRWFRA